MTLRALFSRRERLRIRASGWLSRLEAGASEAERRDFRRWLDADQAHADAFARVRARYGGTGLMTGTDFARTHSLAEPSAVAPAFGAPAAAAPASRALAMAAGLATLAIAAGAVLLGRPDALMPTAQAHRLSFATGIGEIRRVPLPDGSRMVLDTSSAVTVEMTSQVRQVTLRSGRARLAVAVEDRPFVASAGAGRVRADGGIFDIALTERLASVQAIEGAVLVEATVGEAPPAPLRLAAGEAVSVAADGAAPQSVPASRADAMWPTGMLQFDDTPLRVAVAQANRYSGTRLTLAGPELGALRVTGTFRAGDVAGLARSLAAAFGLRLERDATGNLLLHSGKDRPRLVDSLKKDGG